MTIRIVLDDIQTVQGAFAISHDRSGADRLHLAAFLFAVEHLDDDDMAELVPHLPPFSFELEDEMDKYVSTISCEKVLRAFVNCDWMGGGKPNLEHAFPCVKTAARRLAEMGDSTDKEEDEVEGDGETEG